jgi:hypothetical protein
MVGHDGAAAPSPNQGIPFMITQGMNATLRSLGYEDEEIACMLPAEAHRIIASRQTKSASRSNDNGRDQATPAEAMTTDIPQESTNEQQQQLSAPPSDPNGCATWVLGKLKALPDDPPAGYQNARQWQLVRAAMIKFATSDHGFGNLLAQALQSGWTLAELFSISADPVVGVRALDQCGAMLSNGRAAAVTRVDEEALYFSDGLAVRKRPMAPGACLVWNVSNNK